MGSLGWHVGLVGREDRLCGRKHWSYLKASGGELQGQGGLEKGFRILVGPVGSRDEGWGLHARGPGGSP